METFAIRMGTKGQVVVPKAIRDRLGLREGDSLMLILDGQRVILRPRPASFTQAMLGLHKELWEGVDLDKWLDEERSSWE